MVKRALISVYDKSGLEGLLPVLAKYDFKIISSGGTARKIRELGYEVIEVGEYTGYPESPEGLVKTLQPKIHGGLLLNPEDSRHKEYMERQGIEPIDLLVVNLYPFEKVIKEEFVEFDKAVENIDIGGPAMIRAAAKGALLKGKPAVVIEPKQYQRIMDELESNDGELSLHTIREFAVIAFKRTEAYDKAITNYLGRVYEGILGGVQ